MRNRIIRIVSVTLLLSILASISFMPITSNAGTSATLTVGTATGKAGDFVDIPITISGNPGIATYGMILNYDSNSLTPISCTGGSVWTGGITFNPNYAANKVLFAGSSSSNYNGDGIIFVVKFQIKTAAVSSSLSITVDELKTIIGTSQVNITNTIANGTVLISTINNNGTITNPYSKSGASIVRVDVTGIINPATDNKVIMIKGVPARYTYYNGLYKFVALVDGSVTTKDVTVIDGTPTKLTYADISLNNTTEATDVNLLKGAVAGNRTATNYFEILASDVNGDGFLNATDYNTLKGFIAGNLAILPVWSK